jgi:hypothetical protein
MTMEDLAECEAEVIQPIKYEYKAKDGQDGVSLWEVGLSSSQNCNLSLIAVPAEWTGTHSPRGFGYHRGARGRERDRYAGAGT